MSDETTKAYGYAEDLTKMWAEFASKVATAGFSFAPNAPPPEAAGQVRDALFRAAEQYWVEFMRSPQFLEAMKQSMDAAIAFRKQVNDFLTRTRHEAQGTARDDIDALMLCIRHLETRMLDRMDELESRLDRISERLADGDGRALKTPGPKAAGPVAAEPEPDGAPAKPPPERPRRRGGKK
jgi:hypothetical protein